MKQLSPSHEALWKAIVRCVDFPEVQGYLDRDLVSFRKITEDIFTDELTEAAEALPTFAARTEIVREIDLVNENLYLLRQRKMRPPLAWFVAGAGIFALVTSSFFLLAAQQLCAGLSVGLVAFMGTLTIFQRRANSPFVIEMLAGNEMRPDSFIIPSMIVGTFALLFGTLLGNLLTVASSSLLFPMAIVVWLLDDQLHYPAHFKLLVFRKFWFVYLAPEIDVLYRHARAIDEKWQAETSERVVLPLMTQRINELLGEDSGKLLVEHDDKGLRRRRPHEPELLVSTSSQRKVQRVLRSTDGGSIAIAGPRGVGKSTLMRSLSTSNRGLSLIVSAPADYAPKEFLAELFQQVCESYLEQNGVYILSPIGHIGRRKGFKQMLRSFIKMLRLIVASGLLAFLAWSTVNDFPDHFKGLYGVGEDEVARIIGWGHLAWDKHRLSSAVVLLMLALILMPFSWFFRINRRRVPRLVRVAHESLARLRAEQTVGWTMVAGVPGISGASLSRASSDKLLPWAFPEMVGRFRDFLSEVAEEEGKPIFIGIDEVDRIASIDQAERFISEVKAIFGIDGCFFVVSVAEEVGSLFARRAIAGRSVFENAFDEVVMLQPLTFEEARDLLQKRVLGLTLPFVYLAYTVSGGLPREIIRVTSRLLEINRETGYGLRLAQLADRLIREELREAIDGTRSRLAQLQLSSDWGSVLVYLLDSINDLASAGDPSVVSNLAEPNGVQVPSDERSLDSSARKTFEDLSAYAYFGCRIIEAFRNFDVLMSEDPSRMGGDDKFELLAAARRELSLSAQSCRDLLDRFDHD
jgi:hypothetical protein